MLSSILGTLHNFMMNFQLSVVATNKFQPNKAEKTREFPSNPHSERISFLFPESDNKN